LKLPIELQDPRGLWLLGALVPLVILYVLKVRRARVTVASTWLWASARRDLMARSPFKRLERQIPLLLQFLALLLLTLALSRPATRHRAIIGDHVAIVVDTSASMGAIDPATRQPRVELARQAAWDALAALSPGADAMVLEAGRDARLVAPLDRDIRRLQGVIEGLSARDVEGDLGAAVALAVDRLRQLGGEKRVLVFTDGNLARPGSLAHVGMPLEIFTVGEPIDNAGIVRVDVRAGSDPATRQEEVQAFALAVNYGARPREAFLTLRLAGATEPLASRRILLAPGERAPVVLTFKPAEGDRGKGLLFELSPRDGLAADDTAYARVPAGQHQPVVLVSSRPSPWLERALRSDPLVDLWRGTPEEVSKAGVSDGALFVYDGVCPSTAPSGDFLVVGPPPGDCLGVKVGAEVSRPTITSWSHGDPRLRFLTLDGVHVSKANALAVGSAAQSLVRAQTDTLGADISTPGRAGTLLAFDVGESDWPLKASFVLFVRNVIEQARSHRAQAGGGGAARAGDPLRVAVPARATRVSVAAPREAAPRAVTARDGLAVVSDTQRAGLYLVSWLPDGSTPAGSVLVPVNLTSEAESDLRKRPIEAEQAGAKVQKAALLADAHTEWSWLVALAALGLVVLDAAWLTRKPRPLAVPLAPPRPDRSRS
jgi:hypothetical protein